VDPALVFRYFGSKSGLFTEAMAGSTEPVVLPDGPVEELPAKLLRQLVFEDWTEYAGEHPLIAMLRSAGHEDMRDRSGSRCAPAISASCQSLPRATMTRSCGPSCSPHRHPPHRRRYADLGQASEDELKPHLVAVARALFGREVPVD
jgi:hypothetical protein